MPGHNITCLYCFNDFDDDEVHFRMETVFSEDKLDPKGEGRSLGEIETDSRFGSNDIKAQVAEFKLREQFIQREDPVYFAFWQEFGGTTEKASVSRDGKTPAIMPYHRPVFDPKNQQHSKYFGPPKKDSDIVNAYGMLYAAFDCFGKKTDRRVCPHCHNPLPETYGKHPVKFVSIIGISGAGKTVYLSQLCKFLSKQLSYFDIAVNPTSIYASEYLEANPVVMGKKLPTGSPTEQLLQPLCFDLVYHRENKKMYHTIVFYDIAGENCVNHERMRGFGRFVEHADSIILIIDPDQFNESSNASQPVMVLQTIYTVFSNRHPDEVKNLPIAISISKGDKIANEIIQKNLDDIQFLQDNSGSYMPRFNAANYNPIHDAIKNFVQRNNNQLHSQMRNLYDNYNYFLFSAIGTSTKKIEIDGGEYDTPAGPTIPKRILEPFVWLLYQYKFIQSSGEIHEPKDWFCNTPSCNNRRNRVGDKYCPVCHIDNKGNWECPKCAYVNNTKEGRWCCNPEIKCKTDKDGLHKGLFTK